jgi:tRNA (cmo5U34)-methyltransferase
MKRDELFRETKNKANDFEFDDNVAEVFDNMVARSVPFYSEQQSLIVDIANKFWIAGTDIYDLGCSTGTTLVNLCNKIREPMRFIGYDSSMSMLEKARQKIEKNGFQDRIEVRHGDLNGDLSELSLNNASIVTLCWTLQFIRPIRRDKLLEWIYNGLVEEGVLIVTEKILTNSTHVNRLFIELYHDFKRRNRYSPEEIRKKREALENVLIPYRMSENVELFQRHGFSPIEIFFQWCNFTGFLCMKRT